MFGRRNIATYVAEFLGTGALTFLFLSIQRSQYGIPLFVALVAGITVMALTTAVGAISGGYFNPALTLGMWTAQKLSTVRAIGYIAAQMLGAWGAYYLYTYFVKNTFPTIGGKYDVHILIAESVGTAVFAFGWAAASFQRYAIGTAAAIAGLFYAIGILAASSAAIGLLNPAVALGVKAWVLNTYVLGPVIGAVVGINLYKYVFANLEAEAAVGASSAAMAPTARIAKPAAKKRVIRKKK